MWLDVLPARAVRGGQHRSGHGSSNILQAALRHMRAGEIDGCAAQRLVFRDGMGIVGGINGKLKLPITHGKMVRYAEMQSVPP